ncbi:MAG: putative FAD-linked oxidoreductase [Phycisphaerae bacterium]|nr:putative FAD-linked oxidoreductase [Phycisphaerae bacterium]
MAISSSLIREFRTICGARHVLHHRDELLVYESDAYPLARSLPQLVIFPTSTEVAAQLIQRLYREKIPIVPRGSGTSLAGGCLCPDDAVCISTVRMNRILEIDLDQECAAVEAGVISQSISSVVAGHGYHYAPDPSSQTTCTIGGNIANNAGGPHTLKYGVTSNHILGLTVVLPDGEILRVGNKAPFATGVDLTRIFVGSEGTLGLVTEAIVKLTRLPSTVRTVLAVFDRLDDATQTVTDIIAAGIIPAALEMMDQAVIRLVEQAYHYGLPTDAEAVLIIELDGLEAGIDRLLQQVLEHCRARCARSLDLASDPQKRMLLWKARKSAFGALGRSAPTVLVEDGVVPRSQLPHILRFIRGISRKYDLPIANNFHAGDGNIHPNFLFDGSDPQQVARVQQAGDEILAECVRLGGSITGEHGVGIEKIRHLPLMFNDADLAAQQRLRDLFDPHHLANPNKIFSSSMNAAVTTTADNRADRSPSEQAPIPESVPT